MPVMNYKRSGSMSGSIRKRDGDSLIPGWPEPATLAGQRDADGHAPIVASAHDVTDRLAMSLRCAAHADHHGGQMMYLCKQITPGDLAAGEARP
jgi:hypothetical protein